MRKLSVLMLGLWFVAAAGIVTAEDAAKLQGDKEKAQDKVNVDKQNLESSNKEISDAKDSIHEHNQQMTGEKRAIKHHAKKLSAHRDELKDAKEDGRVYDAHDDRMAIQHDKKEIHKDAVALKKHRAQRAKKIEALKDERGENHDMGKTLDKSEQNLQTAKEKAEDKKQEGATK